MVNDLFFVSISTIKLDTFFNIVAATNVFMNIWYYLNKFMNKSITLKIFLLIIEITWTSSTGIVVSSNGPSDVWLADVEFLYSFCFCKA